MTTANEPRTPARAIPHGWVLAALFVTYVVTRYPDVGGRINMGDSAKFQFLSRVLGVGHSPGNPLYLMASALWVRLPLPLSDATMVTVLSGVFGIAAVALAARAVGALALPPVIARPVVLEARSFAAVLLGLGSLFWTLATEAEVYTLGSVFVAGVVEGMARWTTKKERRALDFAIACLGLGLANHLTIAALGPAVLYVLLRESEGRTALRSLRLWAVAVGALALAALAYGWIAWRVKSPPLRYSELPGPFEWPTFLRFVTARGVMDGTAARPSYVSAVSERLPELFGQLEKQWSWPLLLFLPFGLARLFATHRTFAAFLTLGVLGHFGLAFLFRIPDPEGLFVPVSVLLVTPLVLAPGGVALALGAEDDRHPVLGARVAIAMLGLHGALAVAHVSTWYRHPFSAYIQQTPEGKVVLNLPTLHEVVPEHAMVGVPCGHYGCVEVTSYYALVDRELHEKDVSFVRFSWSEWDDGKTPVPLVDPRARRTRPICVLLSNDVAKLRELRLDPRPVPRPPVHVLGQTFTSAPLFCVDP